MACIDGGRGFIYAASFLCIQTGEFHEGKRIFTIVLAKLEGGKNRTGPKVVNGENKNVLLLTRDGFL